MKIRYVTLAILFFLSSFVQAAPAPSPIRRTVRYDGHKIVQIDVAPSKIVPALHDMNIDVVGKSPNYVQFRIPEMKELDQVFAKIGKHDYKVVVDDLQKIIDKETESLNKNGFSKFSATQVSDDWFKSYHRYDEIVTWYKTLATTFPDLMKVIPSIGKTHENRDIIALRITAPSKSNAEKKQVYFQAGQHAREWLGVTTAQFIVYNLLTKYGKEQAVTDLLDSTEIVVVPLVNPDGYEYTWTGDRMWRKNRRKNSGGTFGVDPNRNWAYNWGKGGSSTSPRSDVYMGPAPESEPEVKSVADFFRSNTRIVGAIDFHTFSQLILRPWGDTEEKAPHEAQHAKLGNDMRDIIYSVSKYKYTSQLGIDLYVTTGTASDWFYVSKSSNINGEAVYPYGITIELRPASAWSGGFALPPSEIIPTGLEIFPSFMHFAKTSVENTLTDRNKS